MSWVCPICRKRFKHGNQAHSCHIIPPMHHFENKLPEVKATYAKLIREVKKFGRIEVNSVKHSILLKGATTFLAIRPKKNHLHIEFILPNEITDFPAFKTMRYSKNRVAHFTVLESRKDVTKQLLHWLRESYELVKN
jgi:hypothetical protein